MGKLDEIREIYNLYTLNGKRACQWWNWIPNNKSIATIKKYITIYEGLDFSLLEHIDKKKDDKLTLDIAMYLIKNVNNHDLQFKLFSEIKCLPTKEKKKAIDESMYCLVCADKFPAFEVFPCCEQAVCERCMFEYISTAINGISFSPINVCYVKRSIHLSISSGSLHPGFQVGGIPAVIKLCGAHIRHLVLICLYTSHSSLHQHMGKIYTKNSERWLPIWLDVCEYWMGI